MRYQSIFSLFILFLSPGCIPTNKKTLTRILHHPPTQITPALKTNIDLQMHTTDPSSITVWVHGTRVLPRGVMESFFYSKPGLNHYTSIESYYHQREIAQTLIKSNPELFPAEHFYLFGWNGKLSFKEREKAARKLYHDLKVVRDQHKKIHGTEPIIRMISHSHGGNVILLLEQVKDPADTDFYIQEVILLATPVQKQTMNYARAQIFGKVYSLYSILDFVQVIDPQGLQQKDTDKIFSERYFPADEKIEQVAIKKNDRSIMHMEFVKLKFLAQIPYMLAEIDSWHSQSRLCASEWAKKDKCLCITTKRVS